MSEDDVELSEELRQELGYDSSCSNELESNSSPFQSRSSKSGRTFVERPHNAVPSLKRGAREAAEVLEQEKVTKRKKKALAKIEIDKAKKERRKQLVEMLSQNQLSNTERQMLTSTTALGHKLTAKEAAKQNLLREKVGVVIAADNEVVPTVSQKNAKQRSAKLKREHKGQVSVAAKLVAPKYQDSSSDSDSDSEMDTNELTNTDVPQQPMTLPEPAPEPNVAKIETPKPLTVPAVKYSNDVIAPRDVDGDENERLTQRTTVRMSTTKTAEEEFALSKFVVPVQRDSLVQETRQKLPVCLMEQEIMEAIEANSVVVLCGETGSGKTTQVPQFLFEAGYGCPTNPDPSRSGIVAITQPRRVATVSMAERVRAELCGSNNSTDEHWDTVGYQIRYDSKTVNPKTRLKFMTDGVLLREAREDLLLRRYSVIILDEAHERNLNTDILLGLLSSIVRVRADMHKEGKEPKVYPLKVLIMSATLRVDDFAKNPRLFTSSPPPVVNVEARQYPVVDHFSRRTELRNFLAAAFRKVCAIHKRLPSGGILVFLTGQREIEWMCDALRNKFAPPNEDDVDQPMKLDDENVDYSDIDSDDDADEKVNAPDSSAGESDDEENTRPKSFKDEMKLKSLPAAAHMRIRKADRLLNRKSETEYAPLHVLPLYARLPTAQQLEVFKDVPKNHRLVVVATNVAETSITIPGIRYVVDSGREKRKTHDQETGTSKFEIAWISKASANQRMGRAGRTGPGHCYRLYSSAVFNDQFSLFPDPEIVSLPIEDVILYMKSMGISQLDKFPFPTMPNVDAVRAAESRLLQLGALKRVSKTQSQSDTDEIVITGLGRRLTSFPVRARLGKMLAITSCDKSASVDRVAFVVAMVAALSLQEPFQHAALMEAGSKEKETKEEDGDVEEASEQERAKNVHEMWKDPDSDALALLKASGAYAHTLAYETRKKLETFCRDHLLHAKTMKEQVQLRSQLASLVAKMRLNASESEQYDPESDVEEMEENGEDDELDEKKQVLDIAKRVRGPLPTLSDSDKSYMRQMVTAGYLDQIAVRLGKEEARMIADEYKFSLKGKWPYKSCNMSIDYPIFIHPHSYCFSRDPNELPEYVTYGQITAVERVMRQNPDYLTDSGDESEESEEGDGSVQEPLYYMRQVTRVEESWLFALSEGTSQCTLSRVLTQPSPTYDKKHDIIKACTNPMFGPRRWKLAPQWVDYPIESSEDLSDRTRWFARLLMEGKVINGFSKLQKLFAIPATYLTLKIHDIRVENLITALYKGDSLAGKDKKKIRGKSKSTEYICTKRQLLLMWKKNPMFLYSELQQWLRKESKNELKTLWSEITQDKS